MPEYPLVEALGSIRPLIQLSQKNEPQIIFQALLIEYEIRYV